MLKTLTGPILLAIIGVAGAYNLRNIPVTHWVDDGSGRRPGTYLEYRAVNPTASWRAKRVFGRGDRYDRKMDIIVNSALYDSIDGPLDTMVSDLTLEGYAVSVVTASGGTPESLKALLQREHTDGMEGALLIGNLPIAWYQMIDDWDGDTVRDPGEGYEEFPSDLYYMDLNGTWLDTMHNLAGYDSMVPGADGIYDQHGGDLAPEIWLGRIVAAPCGDEETLVSSYLRKVHRYRTGDLALNDRALVFIDDDWVPWAAEFDGDVGQLYPSHVLISDPETTVTDRYRLCLHENYQWVGLFAHSSPTLHAMKYNGGNDWTWFYSDEIPNIDPQANFYNLFCCSNSRFTEANYMGGRYVYCTSDGLNSVGTTKTGSMLDFQYFYQPMGDGSSIGEAFRDWFSAEAAQGFDPVQRSWFYGMCLNGDPTIKPRLQSHDVGVTAILSPADTVDSGAAITPVCRVTNFGTLDETFTVRLKIGTSYDRTCTLTLARGAEDSAVFPVWQAGPSGTVAVRCSTELTTDTRHENDADSMWVAVGTPSGLNGRTSDLPRALTIQGVYPNPVSGRTVVSYLLPRSGPVGIALYDSKGGRVRSVRLGVESPGLHTCQLETRGDDGRELASGVYLLRLEVVGASSSRRLIIAR